MKIRDLLCVFQMMVMAVLPCVAFGEKIAEEKEVARGHVFAWPFADWKEMQPRGGTSKGGDVTLRREAKEAWKKLKEDGLEKFERDRRAILAMAGEYRVSFDFVETVGFSEGYKPKRPYFSWGTEHVAVLEDKGEFISLQHALVMYFENEKGEVQGPHVMKHWRQDWTWEDKDLHVFDGDGTWLRVKPDGAEGKWSQAVFQVDDSPRYEVPGEWSHVGGMSVWTSEMCPRPLPRREFSERDDYNVLEGIHEITITPTGWLHVQNNRKLSKKKDGSLEYVGQELGVDRYEEIASPELAAAFERYWEKTAGYWKSVRETWAEVYRERDRFSLAGSKDGVPLFSEHFRYAGEMEKAEQPDAEAAEKHARETIHAYLEPNPE